MSKKLSKDEILYLQRTCAVCGIYAGPLDGQWTLSVAEAEENLAKKAREIRDEIGEFDARTEANIATLMPPAQRVARQFMRAAEQFHHKVRIISGSRTYPEQEALYAIGRTAQLHRKPVTKARGGRSNHNFGIAWDVAIFEPNGRYMDGTKKADIAAYADLAKLAKAKVIGIEWGGDWTGFVDPPHYQLATGGKSVAQVRGLFEAGKAFA